MIIIINASYSKLSKELKNCIEILVSQAFFKLWINFHFFGELTEGQLLLFGGAHWGTARNKRAVPQWAPPKSESHSFGVILTLFGVIFTRYGMIFTRFDTDFTRLEGSLRFSLFWRITISLFLH